MGHSRHGGLADNPRLPPTPLSPSSRAVATAALEAFFAALRVALDADSFESLVLSKPRKPSAGPRTVRVRRIALRGAPALSFVRSFDTRDETANLGIEAGLAGIAELLDPAALPSFGHATLHDGGSGGDLQLMVSAKGQATLRPLARSGRSTASPPASHDRVRERRLGLDLPFLPLLGLTDAEHRLVPAMARKWRQIDKFLEVLDAALDAALVASGPAAAPLRVVDYGAGKGYLTFAVYAHLRQRYGNEPEVTGVELRPELVATCNEVATRCGYGGLRFVAGDLRSHVPEQVDVMIALHACDTATDHALDLGLRAGAGVLVCSPCCHKELRPQMARPAALAGVLRHGIHLGQEAEMVTDSLRALLLDASGYDAQVFEFVSLEHTRKNKMILATRRSGGGDPARALQQLGDVKGFYGIREQAFEALLRQRGVLPARASG